MGINIKTENSFLRDLKRMKRRGKDLLKLKTVLVSLEENIPLAAKYRNHKLTGNFKGYWECHVEPDWL